MNLVKIILLSFTLFTSSAWSSNHFQVLSFHDIVPTRSNNLEIDDVTADNLINYFSWLKENGYHVISIQDVIDSRQGKKTLPSKSILLTFDDGYKSFYTFVFPLLKTFKYPATLAVVGSWLDVPEGGKVQYGKKQVPRSHFVSLSELKELSQSPLIEIASHTYDLHRGIQGNIEGNEMPALTTFAFDPKTNTYESEASYLRRIQSDLKTNSEWIRRHTGKPPRIVVWPYGRYNTIAQNIAKQLGMDVAITLDDGESIVGQPLDGINRIYLINNPTISQFADQLRNTERDPKRVMHVDLDYIYDKDPLQQEKNLGLLLERIKASGVNTVYLQAFSDDDGSGVAKSLYFKNRNLPVKADLFGRASWQIRTRLGVNVYAWMPLLAFSPDPEKLRNLDVVSSIDGSKGIGYFRLSPFSDRSRQFIREIYEDLAKYDYFYGIVIHDDATLSDKEDASGPALEYYSKKWGLPADILAINADPNMREKWTKLKTESLTNFALEMKVAAENYKKPLRLSRNYYAEVALNPASEEWFAQSIPNGITNFDWVALMAMPYMEKASNPTKWLNELINKTEEHPGAKQKVIYELQAKNWDTRQAIPSKELSNWMRMLRAKGALNFGYYPDDPFTNQPNIDIIKRELSTESEIKP